MDASKERLINENFLADEVSAGDLDRLLADGWRHFGRYFFRYNLAFYENELRAVIPLRVRICDFAPSKSQKRIIKRNSDLKRLVRPTIIDGEKRALFRRHRIRFKRGRPDSLLHFLDIDAARRPCEGREICLFDDRENLAAVSFFDVGERSISGIYAMFDPDHSKRSLGIYTILLEIELAAAEGKEFYYQGYAYSGSSFYDYKKGFEGVEYYDWNGCWKPLKD